MLEGAPGIKIGVGYDIQLIDEVPAEELDQRMDLIVTQKEVFKIIN